MTISSNTLIHFTESKENLLGILEENFRVYFCRETVILEDTPQVYYVPMVSFCDIPLSEVKDHVSKYGKYGIGMTKEWGIKNGLNPVLYMAKGSKLSISYRTAYRHFNQSIKVKLHQLTEEQRCLLEVNRYFKNYEADLVRKGKTIKNYRFYDEREWRYTPSREVYPNMVATEKWYSDVENKAAADALVSKTRLKFDPNDIKYIIINDDSEIREFIDHLRYAKGKRYSLDEVERLTTRIITTEQIVSDL